jgi:uncharacterized protein
LDRTDTHKSLDLTANKETLDRELRPLRNIPDNYPKFLVTLDDLPPSSEEGIQRITIEKFLMQKEIVAQLEKN